MPDLSRRRLLSVAVLAPRASAVMLAPLAAPGNAHANAAVPTPPELRAPWPDQAPARLQGQGRLRFLGLSIYDIRLWARADQPVTPESWPRQALALEIIYRRGLVGRLIAERSIKEMERAGPLEAAQSERWLRDMTTWFPDVAEGDRLTGLHAPGTDAPARFFHNGQARGSADDAAFARRFFGIWLDEKTSEPALREQLLGLR
jgi:hypothetical protein